MRHCEIAAVALLGCAAPHRLPALADELPLRAAAAAPEAVRSRRWEVVRIGAPQPAPLAQGAETEGPPAPESGPPRRLTLATPRSRRVDARPWSERVGDLRVGERLAVVPLPALGGSPGALVSASGRSPQTIVPQASTGTLDPGAVSAYDAALSLVRSDRCHDALSAFASFLSRWPDHPHADNAMYWRGECLLRLGETQRGIEEFDALLRRYPSGNKAPDALLKLFLTWRAVGDEARATAAAERLLHDFPGSDAARRAQAERRLR